ncbi:Competence protein CoiA-like family, contains a predicted nuclease domain [Amphibacillus marinus]|uniref:Competence protein CoiA-like family, contains a predicted nuclease domain n=1 Tax=Amphibacillus marinus TaxID=872970 RepID=A0A1H8QAS7_9BACI|nr:competence protein CoiA family protein [Amphibacillus marinus]SEO50863.1 Competence protein CoiA-like family, contains a predicted nuclease domain [Amphibacillus marinus]
MLQALNDQGFLVTPGLFKQAEIIRLKLLHSKYYCPSCRKPVTLKAGSKYIAHFAHESTAICINHSEEEGLYHAQGKLQLYQWLLASRLVQHVQLECYFQIIKRRADLSFQLEGAKRVIEFQCAAISATEIITRTRDYQTIGIQPIWILGANQLKRVNSATILLSKTQEHYLQMNDYQGGAWLLFYCSNSKKMIKLNNTCLTGKQRTVGNLNVYSLYQTDISRLLQEKDTFLINEQWLYEKKRFRMATPSRLAKQDKQFQVWLYQSQLHRSVLSSWVGLPVKGQHLLNCSIWEWQARIYYDFFKRNKRFSLKQLQLYIQPFKRDKQQYLLLKAQSDPISEYLNYFLMLGQLVYQNSTYCWKGSIRTYKTLDVALRKDLQLCSLLNKALQEKICSHRLK